MCYKLDQSWILIDDKCSADQKLENILHIALSRNLTCLLRSSMNEARCRRSIRLGLCNPTQWREWKITRLPVTHTSIVFIFKKFLETRNIFLRYYFFRFSSFFSILQPILVVYLFDIPLMDKTSKMCTLESRCT